MAQDGVFWRMWVVKWMMNDTEWGKKAPQLVIRLKSYVARKMPNDTPKRSEKKVECEQTPRTCFWGLRKTITHNLCQEVVYFFVVPEKFKRWRWQRWFVFFLPFSSFFSVDWKLVAPKKQANFLGKRCCKHVLDRSINGSINILYIYILFIII